MRRNNIFSRLAAVCVMLAVSLSSVCAPVACAYDEVHLSAEQCSQAKLDNLILYSDDGVHFDIAEDFEVLLVRDTETPFTAVQKAGGSGWEIAEEGVTKTLTDEIFAGCADNEYTEICNHAANLPDSDTTSFAVAEKDGSEILVYKRGNYYTYPDLEEVSVKASTGLPEGFVCFLSSVYLKESLEELHDKGEITGSLTETDDGPLLVWKGAVVTTGVTVTEDDVANGRCYFSEDSELLRNPVSLGSVISTKDKGKAGKVIIDDGEAEFIPDDEEDEETTTGKTTSAAKENTSGKTNAVTETVTTAAPETEAAEEVTEEAETEEETIPRSSKDKDGGGEKEHNGRETALHWLRSVGALLCFGCLIFSFLKTRKEKKTDDN